MKHALITQIQAITEYAAKHCSPDEMDRLVFVLTGASFDLKDAARKRRDYNRRYGVETRGSHSEDTE